MWSVHLNNEGKQEEFQSTQHKNKKWSKMTQEEYNITLCYSHTQEGRTGLLTVHFRDKAGAILCDIHTKESGIGPLRK